VITQRRATARPNPYLNGVFAPVAEETTAFDLPVTGTLPPELEGRVLLIGPNPIAAPDPRRYSWFLGDGMVHGVRLRAGRAEWYRNRWIRSKKVARVLGGPRTPTPRRALMDTVNTSVIELDGTTLALVEGGCLPVELTRELETVAYTDLGGTLPSGFTAHPKADPVTGELHAAAYFHGRSYVQYIVIGKDGRARKVERIDLPGGTPMMHEISLTERYVVLYDLPLRFSWSAAVRRRMPYAWNRDYPARFGVLPREGCARDIRWFETDPCFIFHTFNAYEDGDAIVLDAVRYESVFADPASYPDTGALPELWRYRIDLVDGRVGRRQIDDRKVEMPRVDDRRIGRAHRYGYCLELDAADDAGTPPFALIKYDLTAGTSEVRRFGPGSAPGEPLFVPRDHAAAEDDGWVLSYVYDAQRGASDLVVLHAQEMTGTPLATVHLPCRVPLGFHGNYLPDR
jgi:carotenoid cleavage dioxygenase